MKRIFLKFFVRPRISNSSVAFVAASAFVMGFDRALAGVLLADQRHIPAGRQSNRSLVGISGNPGYTFRYIHFCLIACNAASHRPPVEGKGHPATPEFAPAGLY